MDKTQVYKYAEAVRESLAEDVVASRNRTAKSGHVGYVYASRRHACVRKMALDMLFPNAQTWTPDQLFRFGRGNERERSLNIALARAGERSEPPFKLEAQQQRFEIKDRDGTVLIVGKKEGYMVFDDGFKAVYEIKSGQTFMHCQTIEDLDAGRWTAHAVDQLLSYLLDNGQELGFFVIDRSGLPTIIPVVLEEHLARAEGFLVDARRAVDATAEVVEYTDGAYSAENHPGDWAELLPDYTDKRPLCRLCPHLNERCTPPSITMGAGIKFVTDEELVHAAERSVEIENDAKEFKRLRAHLAEQLRGVDHAILGSVEMRGSWRKKSSVVFPDTVEAEADKKKALDIAAIYKVTKAEGSFVPSYKRIPRPGEKAVTEGES